MPEYLPSIPVLLGLAACVGYFVYRNRSAADDATKEAWADQREARRAETQRQADMKQAAMEAARQLKEEEEVK